MKDRSTKVDVDDFKHELLNRLRSTMAMNVLKHTNKKVLRVNKVQSAKSDVYQV